MDKEYMKIAFEQAKKAFSIYEVPVGAIIVYKDKVIAKGYNRCESSKDPTAHAEMMAIKQASKYLNAWRLLDCTMYVTLEPCAMCAGAIVNSRMNRLVIGAKDEKRGCCGTIENLTNHTKFNHRVEVEFGVLENECSKILSNFFKELRNNNK